MVLVDELGRVSVTIVVSGVSVAALIAFGVWVARRRAARRRDISVAAERRRAVERISGPPAEDDDVEMRHRRPW